MKDGRRVEQPKEYEYNNQDEDNSVNGMPYNNDNPASKTYRYNLPCSWYTTMADRQK